MSQNPIIPPSPDDDTYTKTAREPVPLIEGDDPFALFATWLLDAKAKEPNDANAVALASVDDDGLPDVRMVLLKDVSPDGFSFFTNYGSAKGQQLTQNPKAALCFHWKSLRRQVRVRGAVSRLSAEASDEYFATRARDARIGAWASKQSTPLESRFAFEAAIAKEVARFGIGPVPRPDHWGGFLLEPQVIEFWRDRPFRLHDRLVFSKSGDGWSQSRLYP